MSIPVYVETGSKKVFACAVDWPGWCRAAPSEEAALEALAAYGGRYRPVAEVAGVRFPKSAGEAFDIVERVEGSPTTDFGAPDRAVTADHQPLTKAQAGRLADLVAASWTVFDRVVAAAPAELRKGPRGGGRDRDKIVDHVQDAEAGGYFRKVGLRRRPPAGDRAAVEEARAAFGDLLRAARGPRPDLAIKTWPWRYAARRVAWHALDHAWEIEDRG